MSITKKILKSRFVHELTCAVLAGYMWFVKITCRKSYHIDPAALPYVEGRDNAIFSFWHGRMMMVISMIPQKRKVHALISMHSDGRLISRVIRYFGLRTINGSTSKGGKEALRQMLRTLKAGEHIMITPDGPRGPLHIASRGVATLARLSKKPVLPITYSTSRYKIMGSWDKFMLALPFGRCVLCIGAPIMVQEDEEALRLSIEHAMNAQLSVVDALVTPCP